MRRDECASVSFWFLCARNQSVGASGRSEGLSGTASTSTVLSDLGLRETKTKIERNTRCDTTMATGDTASIDLAVGKLEKELGTLGAAACLYVYWVSR